MGYAGTSGLGTAACLQVLGILGHPAPEVAARMRAAAIGLTPLLDTPNALAWGGAGLRAWGDADHRGWTWGATAPEHTPHTWESAARDGGAAGLWQVRDEVVLHADGLGLHDVFVRRHGEAVCFSTRLEPLLAIDDRPVTPDPAAWASCLAVGAAVGALTPVTEVQRLTAGTARVADRAGRVRAGSTRPLWDDLPARPPSPAEVAETLAAALPAGDAPVVVTLSGGWDSRVLASLALRGGHRVEAWTTYQYHPDERDLRWSRPVAEALGIPQRLVLPRGRDWAGQLATLRRRTGFQTWMHAWLVALAEELHRQPLPVLDGVYGDALLRANLAGRAERYDGAWQRGLFDTIGGKRLLLLSPEVRGPLAEAAYDAYRTAVAPADGHPNRSTLGQLLTRQARAVAMSPRLLFGPETEVWMPFAHPAVVRAALAVPLADKQGNVFYRELLETACGPEGRLRSSNDPGSRGLKKRDSFLAGGHLAALADTIRGSERALALLEPGLRVAATDPEALAALRRRLRPADGLSWAALLADWEREHGSRLDWSGWPG